MVAILVLSIVVCAAGIEVLPCFLEHVTRNTSRATTFIVNASCTEVLLSNLTFQGGDALLRIDVGALVEANPTAPLINVTVETLSLLSGAAAIVSGGLRRPYKGPRVAVTVRGLRAWNGGLGVTGSFPPGAALLVTGADMTSDNSSLAPTFLSLDSSRTRNTKQLILSKQAHRCV
jgi:hypothetical protein